VKPKSGTPGHEIATLLKTTGLEDIRTVFCQQCSDLPEEGLTCPQLRYMCIDSPKISFSHMLQLASPETLQRLDLNFCTFNDDFLLRNVPAFTNLESLSLNRCKGFTARGLIPFAKNSKNLRFLDFTQTSFNADHMQELADYLPNIETIIFGGYRMIPKDKDKTDVKIEVLKCPTLTDKTVIKLLRVCPKLTTLSLCGAPGVTFKSNDWFDTKNLTNMSLGTLQNLTVASCENITDESIVKLGKFGINLTSLDLLKSNVSARSTKAFIEEFKQLRTLVVVECDNLPAVERERVRLARPSLRIIDNDNFLESLEE